MQELIQDLPGWRGTISHKEAEKLLISKKSGTYLIRKGDPITASLKESLSEENHAEIECYILTIVEDEQKIEDVMLVKIKDKWVLYHDDPDLADSSYKHFDTLKAVLSSLKDKAKYPLLGD